MPDEGKDQHVNNTAESPKEDTSDSQSPIQTEAIPISSQIPTGLARHMCRCQHHVKECVSDDVQ